MMAIKSNQTNPRMSYADMMKELNRFSLEQRIREDMIEVFKILRGGDIVNPN